MPSPWPYWLYWQVSRLCSCTETVFSVCCWSRAGDVHWACVCWDKHLHHSHQVLVNQLPLLFCWLILTDFSKIGAECSCILANGVIVSFSFPDAIFPLLWVSAWLLWWSPRPGRKVVLVTRLGLLVRRMYRIALSLAGFYFVYLFYLFIHRSWQGTSTSSWDGESYPPLLCMGSLVTSVFPVTTYIYVCAQMMHKIWF